MHLALHELGRRELLRVGSAVAVLVLFLLRLVGLLDQKRVLPELLERRPRGAPAGEVEGLDGGDRGAVRTAEEAEREPKESLEQIEGERVVQHDAELSECDVGRPHHVEHLLRDVEECPQVGCSAVEGYRHVGWRHRKHSLDLVTLPLLLLLRSEERGATLAQPGARW